MFHLVPFLSAQSQQRHVPAGYLNSVLMEIWVVFVWLTHQRHNVMEHSFVYIMRGQERGPE